VLTHERTKNIFEVGRRNGPVEMAVLRR
jgi:hypothetical protein